MDRPNKQIIGWREWLSLPDLGIDHIKAKVDTGARTSCLHAYFVETFRHQGRDRLRFGVHPVQKRLKPELICEADLLEQRRVSDSGGHHEMRYVIKTRMQLGPYEDDIELTLTDRDSMKFRMLLGRKALEGRYMVDSGASYLVGYRPPKK